jgi:hypothetical protein
VIEAGAAPGLGHGDPEEAELGHAGDQLLGVAMLAIDLGGLGRDLVGREVASGLLDSELLFGQGELHGDLLTNR